MLCGFFYVQRKCNENKNEIIQIDRCNITVDVSLLSKTDEMFLNATEIASQFDKKPNDFLRLDSTKEYTHEVLKEDLSGSGISRYEDLINSKVGGKYQGTWLHRELVLNLQVALFRRRLHKWVEARIEQEHDWKRKRIESKTSFLPMTQAILKAHDPIKFYHFSIESDMINRIVLGMSAKKFKQSHGIENIRDALNAEDLVEITRLQIINTGLIEIKMNYKTRRKHLLNGYVTVNCGKI